MSLDTASMEEGILEAIEAIRPALQSDGGDIVYRASTRTALCTSRWSVPAAPARFR